MANEIFDRETLLDLSVNAIPLVIILFFAGLFLVLSPFQSAPAVVAVQFAILVAMFAGLAILTYYAGKAVSSAENELEEAGLEVHEASAPDPEGEPNVDETDVANAPENGASDEA